MITMRLFPILVAAAVSTTCAGPEPFEPIVAPGAFVVEGTVWRATSCWGIVTDSTAYQAIGLDERYQRDGLRVKASVRLADEQLGVCMIGPIVDVLSVARQ